MVTRVWASAFRMKIKKKKKIKGPLSCANCSIHLCPGHFQEGGLLASLPRGAPPATGKSFSRTAARPPGTSRRVALCSGGLTRGWLVPLSAEPTSSHPRARSAS